MNAPTDPTTTSTNPDEVPTGEGSSLRLPDAATFAGRHWLLLVSMAGFLLFISKLLMISNGSTETAVVLLNESVSFEVLVWHFARLFPDLLPFVTVMVLFVAVVSKGPWYLFVVAAVMALFALAVADALTFAGLVLGAVIGIPLAVKFLLPQLEREPEHEGRVRPEYWLAVLLGMFALTFQLPQFYFNSDDLWLNREVVELADGSERVAFVAGTHDGWYTLLVDHDRSIEYVHSDELVGRVICRAPEADFYLPWWGQSVLGWLSGRPEPQWPECPEQPESLDPSASP